MYLLEQIEDYEKTPSYWLYSNTLSAQHNSYTIKEAFDILQKTDDDDVWNPAESNIHYLENNNILRGYQKDDGESTMHASSKVIATLPDCATYEYLISHYPELLI